MECLEERALLAGDLSVTWNDGLVTVEGSSGDDVIVINQVGDQIVFDGGSFQLPDGNASLPRTYVDSPQFSEFRIDAGEGNDVVVNNTNIPMRIYGGTGDDFLIGGDGDDELHGDDGDDFLDGGAGDDELWGSAGRDNLHGGRGVDQLHGGADGLQDVMRGDVLDTFINPTGEEAVGDGAARDSNGGYTGEQFGFQVTWNDGVIWIDATNADDTLVFAQSEGRLFIPGWGTVYQVQEVRYIDVRGGAGDDVIINTLSVDSYMRGGDGDDLLVGGRSRDVLWGNAGEDALAGGWGSDSTIADDNVSIDIGDRKVAVLGTSANDRILVNQNSDSLIIYVGTVEAGESRDRQVASLALNHLDTQQVEILGYDGDDYLRNNTNRLGLLIGGAGDDTIFGGGARDIIHGDAGDDRIDGNGGDDYLDGGADHDHLNGGGGVDWAENGEDVINVEPRLEYDLVTPQFDIVTNRIASGYLDGFDEFVSGDFDGDGRDDVLFREIDSGANRIAFARGAEDFTIVIDRIPRDWINGFDEVEVGDFDGDGRDDLLFRQVDSGWNRILFARGNEEFSPVTDRIPRGWINGFDEVVSGDFDGDGRDDLLFREVDSGFNRILFARGVESFVEVTDRIPRGWINGAEEVVAGDFDGDGRDDLLFRQVESGDNRILFARGNEQFVEVTNRIPRGWINGFDEVVSGDFDGDSRDDLMFREVVSGDNRILLARGNEQFEAVTNMIATGHINDFDEFLAGDFDGDGRDDVMFREVASGTNRIGFSRTPVHIKKYAFHDGSFLELRVTQGQAFGTLRRFADGEWESIDYVSSFRIENGALHIVLPDGSEQVQYLQADFNAVMDSYFSELQSPSSNLRSIVGATLSEAQLVNANGDHVARSLLDSVGAIYTATGSFSLENLGDVDFVGSGTLLDYGGNQWVLTAEHVAEAILGADDLLFDVRRFDDQINGPLEGINDGPRGDIYRVIDIVPGSMFGNRDLALLKLHKKVEGVIGARLPGDADLESLGSFSAGAGWDVLTVGYGWRKETPNSAPQLNERNFGKAKIDGVTYDAYTFDGAKYYGGKQLVHDVKAGEAASAGGDSGGPDFAVSQNRRLLPIIVGVHSYGPQVTQVGDTTGSVAITQAVGDMIRAAIPAPPPPPPVVPQLAVEFFLNVFEDGDPRQAGDWDLTITVNGYSRKVMAHPNNNSTIKLSSELTAQLRSGWNNISISGIERDLGFWPDKHDQIASWQGQVALPRAGDVGTHGFVFRSDRITSPDTIYQVGINIKEVWVSNATASATTDGGAAPPKPTVELLDGMLTITGTDRNDDLHVSESDGDLVVSGVGYRVAKDSVQHIEIHGGAGDDDITIETDIPAAIYGEAGDDSLQGGDADDLLDGGEGDDVLYGGAGRNLLRGGLGEDTLVGRADLDSFDGGDGLDRTYLLVDGGVAAIEVDQAADANGDGELNFLDVLEVIEGIRQGAASGESQQGLSRDANQDGVVDFYDALALIHLLRSAGAGAGGDVDSSTTEIAMFVAAPAGADAGDQGESLATDQPPADLWWSVLLQTEANGDLREPTSPTPTTESESVDPQTQSHDAVFAELAAGDDPLSPLKQPASEDEISLTLWLDDELLEDLAGEVVA
ncbi:MAG: FG-GAP-like repeat-containing protein [Pirellulaceae bacterium]